MVELDRTAAMTAPLVVVVLKLLSFCEEGTLGWLTGALLSSTCCCCGTDSSTSSRSSCSSTESLSETDQFNDAVIGSCGPTVGVGRWAFASDDVVLG